MLNWRDIEAPSSMNIEYPPGRQVLLDVDGVVGDQTVVELSAAFVPVENQM